MSSAEPNNRYTANLIVNNNTSLQAIYEAMGVPKAKQKL